jgi:hypothetical protein
MIDQIHGFPVTDATPYYASPGLKDARIVPVKRGENDYVTAYHCRGETSWGWGHYFDALGEAFADYVARAIDHRSRGTRVAP